MRYLALNEDESYRMKVSSRNAVFEEIIKLTFNSRSSNNPVIFLPSAYLNDPLPQMIYLDIGRTNKENLGGMCIRTNKQTIGGEVHTNKRTTRGERTYK